MSRPAQPERKDPNIGASNPAASLWDEEKPYTGPPEEGQPRKGSAHEAAPTAPVILGDKDKNEDVGQK